MAARKGRRSERPGRGWRTQKRAKDSTETQTARRPRKERLQSSRRPCPENRRGSPGRRPRHVRGRLPSRRGTKGKQTGKAVAALDCLLAKAFPGRICKKQDAKLLHGGFFQGSRAAQRRSWVEKDATDRPSRLTPQSSASGAEYPKNPRALLTS